MLIGSSRRAVSIHYLKNNYQGAGIVGLMGFSGIRLFLGGSYAQIFLHFWYEDCITCNVWKNLMNRLKDRKQVCQ
jgi:hypothetical protein